MSPMPELSPLLKRLRLSGILESLDQRNRQAVEQKLAYTDFLALLVQDEVARRDQKKFDRRVRRAGFRSQKALESLDFDFNTSIDEKLIRELATCGFVREPANVLLAGPCGTDKSHLAQAFGHEAVRAGYDVLFTNHHQLLASLHAARAVDTFERRFQALVKIDLLIVDDFALKPMKPPQDEDFHNLIAERYERAATIVTSNLELSEWGDAFPNRLLAAATLDRLRDGAYRVILDGESYRKPRPMSAPTKGKKS